MYLLKVVIFIKLIRLYFKWINFILLYDISYSGMIKILILMFGCAKLYLILISGSGKFDLYIESATHMWG